MLSGAQWVLAVYRTLMELQKMFPRTQAVLDGVYRS